MDSSSALALIRRTGTGRLKHIQIKQFYLQNLLRIGVFSIFKINTKINPVDLNTKRLSGERRSSWENSLDSFLQVTMKQTMTVKSDVSDESIGLLWNSA